MTRSCQNLSLGGSVFKPLFSPLVYAINAWSAFHYDSPNLFFTPSPQSNQQEKKSYNERHLFERQKRNGLGVEVGGLEFLSRVGMGRGTRHLPRQKPGWSRKHHEETWVSEMWGRQPSLRGSPGQVHLLYLKWITNKNLPYSTGNSAQCYVTT